MTLRPDRMMVTRCEMAMTSSSLCDTKMRATPCALSFSTTMNRRATSRWVRAVVGSSMMRSFALPARERQMAVSCLSATESCSTSASSGSGTPRRSTICAACFFAFVELKNFFFSVTEEVIMMFSATVRFENRLKSW